MEYAPAIIAGIAAFLLFFAAVAALGLSGRRDARDPVVQELYVRAITGPVVINADTVNILDEDLEAELRKANDSEETISISKDSE